MGGGLGGDISGHRDPIPQQTAERARESISSQQRLAQEAAAHVAALGGGKGADLIHPRVSSLASSYRPEASDGTFDAPRRE